MRSEAKSAKAAPVDVRTELEALMSEWLEAVAIEPPDLQEEWLRLTGQFVIERDRKRFTRYWRERLEAARAHLDKEEELALKEHDQLLNAAALLWDSLQHDEKSVLASVSPTVPSLSQKHRRDKRRPSKRARKPNSDKTRRDEFIGELWRDHISQCGPYKDKPHCCGKLHLFICKRLDARPVTRPPNAVWKHLPWAKAFADPKYHDAVARYLSGAIRERKEGYAVMTSYAVGCNLGPSNLPDLSST